MVIDAAILHRRLHTITNVFFELLGPILYLQFVGLSKFFLTAIILLAIALFLKRSPADQACSFRIAARFLGLLATAVISLTIIGTQAAHSMAMAVTMLASAAGPAVGYLVAYVHEGAGGLVMVLASATGGLVFLFIFDNTVGGVYECFTWAYPCFLSGLLFLAAWDRSRKVT